MKKIAAILFFLPLLFHAQVDELEIKKVVNNTLTFISMEPGSNPNWNEFKDYFTAGATVVLRLPHPKIPDSVRILTWSIDEFIEKAGPNYESSNFKEVATGHEISVFNGIATVFQGYKATFDGEQVYGVNSYQLVQDGKHWKIICMTWSEGESKADIPESLR